MVDTVILRSMLVDDLFGTISENNGRRFARLKESGDSAKLKQVDIYDVPKGSLLLKLDKCDQPKTLFKGKQGERQRCDYILVTSMDNNPMLVFIEMKSAALKIAEIERQFKGAECVLDYCDAILTRFHGQS
ncbi:MAG: hypothetical protein RBR01_10375, partial [Desulfobacterales bacterium]|nr:hypothetical protein [Desulfobacterales bacterium]